MESNGGIDGDVLRKAEEQVEAFILVLQRRYGIKDEEIPGFLDDIRWLRKRRDGLDRISGFVVLGVLGALLSGVMAVLWEGFKKAVIK